MEEIEKVYDTVPVFKDSSNSVEETILMYIKMSKVTR